jgi:hypothetical protein
VSRPSTETRHCGCRCALARLASAATAGVGLRVRVCAVGQGPDCHDMSRGGGGAVLAPVSTVGHREWPRGASGVREGDVASGGAPCFRVAASGLSDAWKYCASVFCTGTR